MADHWADDFVFQICEYLRERREQLGKTIYNVAQTSGISWQSVSAYEQHKRRPTLDCLAKVAVALEMRPSELLAAAESRLAASALPAPALNTPVAPKRKTKNGESR